MPSVEGTAEGADAANGVVATAPVATATVAAAAAADGAGEGLLTTNTSSANGKASSASSDDVAMVTDDAAAASERQPMAAPHAPASTQRQPPGEGEPMRVTIDSNMRLRWSPQLHQHFCNAVAALGGSAFAKPKDIVSRMAVPGLTLAHVKSHLQKHRQQEGVTNGPARSNGPPGRRFARHLAQHGLQQDGAGGSPHSGAAAGLPPAKRARGMRSARAPGPAPSAWAPQLMAAAAAEPPHDCLEAYAGAQAPLLLQPQLLLPLPDLPLPPMPSSEQEEAADALLTLAGVASEQHDELEAARWQAEEQAAAADSMCERVAAAAAAAGQLAVKQEQAEPGQLPEPQLGSQVQALLEQQREVQQRVGAHLQQQAVLLEQLATLQRHASELLSHPQMIRRQPTPAELQWLQHSSAHPSGEPAAAAAGAQQQQQLCRDPSPSAVATSLPAALPLAPVAAQAPPVQQPGTTFASLLALATQVACRAPQQPRPTAPATPSLEQLLLLYQSSALLATHQRS